MTADLATALAWCRNRATCWGGKWGVFVLPYGHYTTRGWRLVSWASPPKCGRLVGFYRSDSIVHLEWVEA